jgi:uracil DNA glycosylase
MQEIIRKINEKLKPSGWYDQLRIFLESSDFSDIIEELKRKVDEDKQRFCPALNTAFRFLEDIKPDKIRAVMLIDYSCNRLDQADGVPLSTPEKFVERTPVYLFQSMHEIQHRYDVNSWVKQGMLIIPQALTTRIEGRSHKKLWSPFIMRLIEAVNKKSPKAPWLLVGSDTWKYEEDIVSAHIRRFELKNPVDDKGWHLWINEILRSQKRAEIIW